MEPIGGQRFKINRIEAGIGQLDMAIHLHFQMVSEVASRTLAASAAVFFQGLVDIKYRRMRLQHISKTLDVRDEVYIDALQNAQWLVQHTHESPAHQSWGQEETELLIIATILNIGELSLGLSAPQRVFKLWYFARKPATLRQQAPATQAAVEATFPRLLELSDAQQRIAGQHRIEMEHSRSDRGTEEP